MTLENSIRLHKYISIALGSFYSTYHNYVYTSVSHTVSNLSVAGIVLLIFEYMEHSRHGVNLQMNGQDLADRYFTDCLRCVNFALKCCLNKILVHNGNSWF